MMKVIPQGSYQNCTVVGRRGLVSVAVRLDYVTNCDHVQLQHQVWIMPHGPRFFDMTQLLTCYVPRSGGYKRSFYEENGWFEVWASVTAFTLGRAIDISSTSLPMHQETKGEEETRAHGDVGMPSSGSSD